MEQINPKLAIILVVLIAASATVYFLTLPFFENIKSLNMEINNAKAAKEEIEKFIAKIGELNSQYKKYENEIGKLANIFPPAREMSDVLFELSEQASQNGLILQSISPSESAAGGAALTPQETERANAAPKPEVTTKTMSLAMLGSYESLKNLLVTLEKNPRVVDVTLMDLRPQKEEDLFSINLRLKMYWGK